MGARSLPVGALVVPVEIDDKAGVVSMDDPASGPATPARAMLSLTKEELDAMHLPYNEGRTVSVPAVLHGIQHVEDYVKSEESIVGHEMEGSTFLHFAEKHGIKAGALFYISDNDKHSIIAGAKSVREARRRALFSSAKVAVAVMQHY